MQYLVYIGILFAITGMIGLGYCIKLASAIKKDANDGQDTKDRMGKLIAANTAAVGIAFIGLAMVAVGKLLG